MRRKCSKKTSRQSTENATSGNADGTTCSRSISSAEDFPVRIFPMPGQGQDLTASGLDCSSTPFAWFENCSQKLSCWRTWQRCLLGGWMPFSGRWPRSGMVVNGIAYQLQPLVPRISGTGCSSWGVLWPTPDASDRGAPKQWTGTRPSGTKESKTLQAAAGGRLNPEWVEWLMGFPEGWTDLEDSETP